MNISNFRDKIKKRQINLLSNSVLFKETIIKIKEIEKILCEIFDISFINNYDFSLLKSYNFDYKVIWFNKFTCLYIQNNKISVGLNIKCFNLNKLNNTNFKYKYKNHLMKFENENYIILDYFSLNEKDKIEISFYSFIDYFSEKYLSNEEVKQGFDLLDKRTPEDLVYLKRKNNKAKAVLIAISSIINPLLMRTCI